MSAPPRSHLPIRALRLVVALAGLFALFAPRAAHAAAPVVPMASEPVGSTGNFDVFIDDAGELTIETIGRVAEPRWHRSTNANPNYGFTKAAIWGRLRMSNPTAEAAHRRLAFRYPLLDHIEMFVERPEGGFSRVVNGDHLRFSERPFDSH